MLDEYVFGDIRRVSPEAPVAVVEQHRASCAPGGAANAAANVRGLGATAVLAGVVGGDEAGRRLCSCLAERGVAVEGLLVDPGRPTTTKTRIVARNQPEHLLDREH